ncbi:Serine protease [Pandoravirus salinus]|uniref:Serine protease n=1 Tax=Pandoravirus salinus TaxID=1349410 RepID=S4VWN0_9VIRU|nr:Trypsin-like peptidase domain [Pandoravirus salinus]AGO83851.1 Serine protease [Pandoravirus salinus]
MTDSDGGQSAGGPWTHGSRRPNGTVARIKAVIMEHNPLEPWHPAGADRVAGSGWFVRLPWERDDGPDHPPRFLVTCNHCVEGVKARDGLAVQTSSTGDALWRARVAAVVPEIDAAIVEVLPTPDVDPRALVAWPLGDDRADIVMGDDVEVYGYPLGQERLKASNSHVTGRERGLLQLDGSINFGDSGGPVVKDGRVVGWVTQGVPEANAVSFAQPVSLLLAALFALRPLPARSPNDWAPYGGLPPPARVLRRGGLGCALYASNNARLASIGARCPDRGAPSPSEPAWARLAAAAPDPWGGGGPRYTGADFGPSGAASHVGNGNRAGTDAGDDFFDGDGDDDYGSAEAAPTDDDRRGNRHLGGDGGPLPPPPSQPQIRGRRGQREVRHMPLVSGTAATRRGASAGCDCPSGAVIQWTSRRSDLARPPFDARPGDVLCGLVLPLVPPGGYADLIAEATEGTDGSAPSPADVDAALAEIAVPVVVDVGNDGAVVLPWTDDRMDVDRALLLVPWGMRVGVRIYRAQPRRSVTGIVDLAEATTVDGFYRPYRPFEPDDYEAFGGIVVGPLTADVVDVFRWLGARLSPAERDQARVVVLRALIGGPLNAGPADDDGVNIREGDIIERVNGRPVSTMDDYREALRAPHDGAYLVVETDRGRGDVVSMATVLAAESDLAAQYGYPLSGTWDHFAALFS